MHLSDWKSPAKATVAAKKVRNRVEERPLVFLRLSQCFATNSLNSAPAMSSGHDCATPSGHQHTIRTDSLYSTPSVESFTHRKQR